MSRAPLHLAIVELLAVAVVHNISDSCEVILTQIVEQSQKPVKPSKLVVFTC